MPNRYDRDRDDRNRGESSGGGRNYGEEWRDSYLSGYYARDTHRGGLSDDYAREARWGGFGPQGDARTSGREAPMQSFRGRGPKNWKRSDERISEDVHHHLTDDHDVDATNIEVRVENGEVTLTGTVSDRWAKRHAEDIAAHVTGVHDVHNQLRIEDFGGHRLGKASE